MTLAGWVGAGIYVGLGLGTGVLFLREWRRSPQERERIAAARRATWAARREKEEQRYRERVRKRNAQPWRRWSLRLIATPVWLPIWGVLWAYGQLGRFYDLVTETPPPGRPGWQRWLERVLWTVIAIGALAIYVGVLMLISGVRVRLS